MIDLMTVTTVSISGGVILLAAALFISCLMRGAMANDKRLHTAMYLALFGLLLIGALMMGIGWNIQTVDTVPVMIEEGFGV